MESVQVIAQTENVTFADVTFGSHYQGSTTITHATNIVVTWIDDVFNTYGHLAFADNPVYVGIHVECTPPNGPIPLIELCVGNGCLVYQVRHSNDSNPPDRLKDFLKDGRFCFVCVDVDQTIQRLQMNNLTVMLAADLGEEALRRLHRQDLRWAGLCHLVRALMGVEIFRLDGA